MQPPMADRKYTGVEDFFRRHYESMIQPVDIQMPCGEFPRGIGGYQWEHCPVAEDSIYPDCVVAMDLVNGGKRKLDESGDRARKKMKPI